jgi:hypothetical protein
MFLRCKNALAYYNAGVVYLKVICRIGSWVGDRAVTNPMYVPTSSEFTYSYKVSVVVG